MMGGAASFKNKKKWKGIIQNVVNGKFVNVYTYNDHILQVKRGISLFDRDPLGVKKLMFTEEDDPTVHDTEVELFSGSLFNYDVSEIV